MQKFYKLPSVLPKMLKIGTTCSLWDEENELRFKRAKVSENQEEALDLTPS